MAPPVGTENETKEFLVNIHFSEDIIIEILRRLPVRILMQFKLVCKPWNSLISDPKFKLSTKRRQRAIMCTTQVTEKGFGTCFDEKRKKLYSLDSELFVQQLPCPVENVPSDSYTLQFLGSCNGLLLFCTSGCIYLWNPSTRCCRQLPQLNGLMKSSSGHLFGIASGLCFDESSNDYKAVIIDTSAYAEDRALRVNSFVYVASLRRQIEWTDINLPYKLINQRTTLASGALVNGHLHWLVEEESDNEIVVVYFDETTNKFYKFPMPETTPHEGGSTTVCLRLIVFDGCLCMCVPVSKFRSIDILVMREYGVKESWTTLFRIQGIQGCFVPLFATVSDDDILVSNAWEIDIYNCKDNSLKEIKFFPHHDLIVGYPLVYEETLESIDWVQQAGGPNTSKK